MYEYGDPSGDPLFFFHGWPGSGRQASLLDTAAKKYSYRVLAPDRPGIGASTRTAQRRITGWPSVTAEMAGALGLDRFSMLGVSGGCPYTLACAAAMPERVIAVSVVCGAPPIAELFSHRSLHPAYRFLLWLFQRRPKMVRRIFALARPVLMWRHAGTFLPPLRTLLPGPDSDTLGDRENFAAVFDCNRDAFLDVDGLFEDAALYAIPWGFRPEDIKAPVQFWHGLEDSNFHWTLAEELAARVPKATLRIIENEGHFSLPIRQSDPILAAMREATAQPPHS